MSGAPGRIVLVLGGARSGKSSYAEKLAEGFAGTKNYIATGQARDEEMVVRIASHQARRGPDWHTLEEPLELARALEQQAGPGRFVLADCLTLWVSNLLEADENIEQRTDDLTAALARLHGTVVLVSNEVGLGIVPANALARRFRDEAGRVNQQVAAVADEVVFIAAGLPVVLKPAKP